jgi:hypothetical protein
MKIKQEIIEARYSIEELTKQEYELLKEGLWVIVREDFRRSPDMSYSATEATKMLEKMD